MSAELQSGAVLLNQRYADLSAEELIDTVITREFPGEIVAISSFGTESALLLALIAEVDRNVPILFIDTDKLFPETLAYRDTLVARLGLGDVRTVRPAPAALHDRDPDGVLWQFDADACCRLRKVEPLAIALGDTRAVISGRKRYHGGLRQFLPRIQAVDGRVKIDPLARWTEDRVKQEFARRNLPEHPLRAEGYGSVGCEPCTIPLAGNAPARAGRWAGTSKTECGIHLPGAAPQPVPATNTF